ncbi:hypothetical protein F4679DRAFT_199891 [Xylaria curta]|nr:hypothetical protein F4679DRAFT_199891 [Xylaria curta]
MCSQVDLSKATGPCPLCIKVYMSSATQYRTHVGHHLEQLGLFALPRIANENDETESQKDSGEERNDSLESRRPDSIVASPRPSDESQTEAQTAMNLWERSSTSDNQKQPPFRDAHTSDVQFLFQISDQSGAFGYLLENPEENSAVQPSHGRVKLDPYVCVECFAAFESDSQLLKHGRDEGHRPYGCLCGNLFSRLSTIKRHLNSKAAASTTSSVVTKHTCPLCPEDGGEKSFNGHDHLLQHLRVFHKLSDKGIEYIIDSIHESFS